MTLLDIGTRLHQPLSTLSEQPCHGPYMRTSLLLPRLGTYNLVIITEDSQRFLSDQSTGTTNPSVKLLRKEIQEKIKKKPGKTRKKRGKERSLLVDCVLKVPV